jgi:hypothetical protein
MNDGKPMPLFDGIAVLYNNLSVPKKLEFQQGRTHMYTMPNGSTNTLSQDWNE